MPKVTVAIPTHNRCDLVVEALESALAQDYADREIVVVDNGSTDETQQRLEPYLGRIRYVRQEDRGRAGARNRAIEEAEGDYIAFLDSDDVWLPGKLERQVTVLDAERDMGLVHGHVEVIDGRGEPLLRETEEHRQMFTDAHRGGATYAGYALRCLCLTSTTMMRRSVLESLGGYDESMELEDLDLYLRIALVSSIAFLEGEPLARYRLHAGQTGSAALTRGQIAVCLKHLDGLRDSVPAARRARRNFCITLARSYHMLVDAPNVRRFTAAAVRAEPSALLVPGVARRLALSFAPRAAVLRGRARRAGLPVGGTTWKR